MHAVFHLEALMKATEGDSSKFVASQGIWKVMFGPPSKLQKSLGATGVAHQAVIVNAESRKITMLKLHINFRLVLHWSSKNN